MFLAFVILATLPGIFFRRPNHNFMNIISEIFGFSFVLLGQLIRISARGLKAENSQNGNRLIKKGPYSLVRNPMYLGIVLISLGVVLILFKW
ncbi:MAG: hypothetical protein FJZ12_00890 [Candidatus Omnitrophica bacterium]|nr:hypothetical protein [Candidatus Omnitrophota bacterium]